MEKFWRENGTHGLPVVAYRTRKNLAPKVPTLLLYARQAHSWDDLDISGMVTEQGGMSILGVKTKLVRFSNRNAGVLKLNQKLF